MAWRYFAQRLAGEGAGEFIDLDLPLSEASITDTLSGPGRIAGNIPVEIGRLKDVDGSPLLKEWGTAIYAEADDAIRAGAILAHSGFNGPKWELDCVGFSGYAKGLPYLDAQYFVQADPMDIARAIWLHIQANHSNLGIVVDDTTSPIRIGTELEQVSFDTQAGPVSFEAGPRKLAWYLTEDLGGEFDKLAKETPFDYGEEHAWNADRTAIEHRLRLYYPRKGVRRNTRLVLNENVFTPPAIELDGETEYANGVMVLGAGEGRDMVRGQLITVDDGRLRRVKTVIDKSLQSQDAASARARAELAWRQRLTDITSLTVLDHPNAPIGSFEVGDEIRFQGDTGWVDLDLWVRVLTITRQPDSGDSAELTVIRSDKVGTS